MDTLKGMAFPRQLSISTTCMHGAKTRLPRKERLTRTNTALPTPQKQRNNQQNNYPPALPKKKQEVISKAESQLESLLAHTS